MINFLEETLDMLKDCGKTEDDVLWVGRHEYDGSEWWEYKRMPTEPFETKDFDLQRVSIYD